MLLQCTLVRQAKLSRSQTEKTSKEAGLVLLQLDPGMMAHGKVSQRKDLV
ncbi:unnamed protein product [Periconia digitata]|uniref:Uncharacterized protein n=1 Tax=Periconia digitata TaxID=1303443 RepID=A0A9W4XM30_9PLEO|nr:unnamed protein product [Periconia digitata]